MAHLMQRILIGSLLFSSLTVVPSALAADKTATVSVSPASGSKTVNTNFTVDFKLNTGGQAVGGVNVKVNYSGLELVSTDATGSVFSNEVTPPGTGNPFSIVRVRFDTGFNGSDGLLLKATFKPTAAGSPTITINQGESEVTAYSDSTNILKSVANGSYTVGGSSTSGSSGSSGSSSANTTTASPAAGTVPVKEKSTLDVKKACAKPDGSDVVLVNVTPKDKDGKVLTGNTYRPSFTGAGLTVVVKATKTAGVWEGVLTSKKEAKVPVTVKSSGVELGKIDAEFKASGCTATTTTTTSPSPSSSLEPSPSISPITKISPRLSPIPTSSNKIKPAHLTLFAIGLILLIGGLIALWKMGHTKDMTHPPKPPAPPSAGPPNPPSNPSPPPPPPIVAPPQ